MKKHRLKLVCFPLVLISFCIHANGDEDRSETLPVLCVELDGFGFKGDYLRIRFEKGFEKAWQQSSLPYEVEFRSFPVNDYKGKPAIELKLNFWKSLYLGHRTLNFWAAFVAPNGEKHKLDLIHHEGRTQNALFYSVVERSYEEQAFDATCLLIEKVKPLLEMNDR